MPEDFDYRRGPGQRRHLEPVQLDASTAITAAAIANCSLCDEYGYRGGHVCDHIDHAATTVAGRAAVREALAAIQAKRRPPPVDTTAADLVARQRAAAPPASLEDK